MISINCEKDDPQLILSRQILLSKYSNYILLINYIYERYELTRSQFGLENLQHFYLVFKYKEIEIDFQSYNKF